MVILGKQMFVDYIVCIWSLIYGICFRLRICSGTGLTELLLILLVNSTELLLILLVKRTGLRVVVDFVSQYIVLNLQSCCSFLYGALNLARSGNGGYSSDMCTLF